MKIATTSSLLFSVCVAFSISAHSTSAQAATSDKDWSQHAGNAGHTRYVNMGVSPDAIKELWSVPISYAHSTGHAWDEWDVAIDESHVYRTALEGYPPSGNFHILALDLDHGTQQWKKTLTGRAHAGVRAPSASDGIVYVNRAGHSGISGGSSADNPKLYGFNADTGQQLFVTNYSDQWGSYDRPNIRGDTVIMEGGYYGGTYAYEATSGAVRWFDSSIGAHLLTQGGFYSNEGLSSYANASKIRDVAHPSISSITLVLANTEANLLLTKSIDTLSAFNDTSGVWEWDYTLASGLSTFAATPDRIVAAGNTRLEVIDRQTGNLLVDWEGSASLRYDQLAVTNTHAFVQDTRGLVSAVNLETGETDWFKSAPIGTLAVGHGLLVLSSRYEVRAYGLIPEPSSLILLGIAGLALILRRQHWRPLL